MPHLQCQPLPSWNSCCKLCVDCLSLAGKDSEQKWYCPALSRICAFPHFIARKNIVRSFPSVLSPGMLWVEEWGSGRRRTGQREGKGGEWRQTVLLGKRKFFSEKCTQSLLLLDCLQLGLEQEFLHRSAACSFVHLGFASGHLQYSIYM